MKRISTRVMVIEEHSGSRFRPAFILLISLLIYPAILIVIYIDTFPSDAPNWKVAAVGGAIFFFVSVAVTLICVLVTLIAAAVLREFRLTLLLTAGAIVLSGCILSITYTNGGAPFIWFSPGFDVNEETIEGPSYPEPEW